MDRHVKDFFCQFSNEKSQGAFHKVIALHEAPDVDMELIARGMPEAWRGWLELALLPVADRIELTREFWLCKMRDHPRFSQFLLTFFDTIDDIGIFLTQHRFDEPFCCHMVYSLPNDSGFFRGKPPATEEKLLAIQNYFSGWVLPADYLSFLQIHDGFAKATDCTGVTPTGQLAEHYELFQKFLEEKEAPVLSKRGAVDPKSLLPFYESFGMPFYQCFWGEWHPEGEMGNVYYSGLTHTITEPTDGEEGEAANMAFATFADWLIFYLETIM